MISANELLSSTMKTEASKCSLKKQDIMKKKEKIELNECFKRKKLSEEWCSTIEDEVIFVVWFENWLILLIDLIL